MTAAEQTLSPAEGVAAARCRTARWAAPTTRTTTDHPRRCGWCDYPDDFLADVIDRFNVWAALDERTGRYGRLEVRRFREQPERAQRAQVAAAQMLEEEPWRPQPAEPRPATVTQIDRPARSPERSPDPPPIAAVPRPSWAGGPS